MTDKAVAVSGAGVLCCVARTYEEYVEILKYGEGRMDILPECYQTKESKFIGAILGEMSIKEELDRMTLLPNEVKKRALQCTRKTSLSVQSAVIVALQTMLQADLFHMSQEERERFGIVIAGNNFNRRIQFDSCKNRLDNPAYISPKYAMEYSDTYSLGVISEILNIHGEGCVVGGISASGNVALIKAWQMICLDCLDRCLVVAPCTDLTAFELQAYSNLGALGAKSIDIDPKIASRPFDQQHDGFIYGQGAGAILLEKEQLLEQRKKKPKAMFLSGATYLDGNRLCNPSEEGEAKAMREAIRRAGLDLTQIDYVNAHGSSSKLGDETEIQAIESVFGNHKVYVNSTKGIIGHCLNSAGVLEAIASVAQMEYGFLHRNNNLEHPMDTNLVLPVKVIQPVVLKNILSNSFGFQGINTSIVIGNTKERVMG